MYTMSSPRPARAMSILRLVGRESAPAPGRLPPCQTSRCLSSKRECARSASCSRPTKCAPEGEPWVWRSALFVRCIAKVVLTANGPARLPQLCAPPINRRLPALICRLAKLLRYRLLAFFAVFGPGFITANVDNDPGGILTYSQAGAKFGYRLLWTLIPTTIALIVVQEMAARMGAVTGKGLHDLIREEFGIRATFFVSFVFGLADLGNIVAEFAGLASGMGLFGISKYFVVPIGAFLVWIVVVHNSYKPFERILILFSLLFIRYLLSARILTGTPLFTILLCRRLSEVPTT